MEEDLLIDYSRARGTDLHPARLGSCRFVVVGAGALGNRVVENLGMAGVGGVLIVDPDIVEPVNLARSLLLREPGCVGRNKAHALAAVAARRFPDTRFESLDAEIADVGLRRMAGAGAIFSCTDSGLARLETAYIAWQVGIPVCDAGLGHPNHWNARVAWLPGGTEPCFGCLLSESQRRHLLDEAWSLPMPCDEAFTEPAAAAAGTATVSTAAAAWQVDFGLHRWLERSPAGAVEWSMGCEPSFQRLTLHRSPSCPFHGERAPRRAAPPGDVTIAELFRTLGDDVEELLPDWPVCTEAVCRTCGRTSRPFRRNAWVRRRAQCQHCGDTGLTPRRTIERITASDFPNLLLSQAGLPGDHEFLVTCK